MLYTILLILHIASGSVALITGALSAGNPKGGKRHKRWGRAFVISMLISALAGLIISYLTANNFLLAIACFTLYLAASGWIWGHPFPPQVKLRWVRSAGMFGLLTAGFMMFLAFKGSQLNLVLIIFGALLLLFAITDTLVKKVPKQYISRHGGRMGGAYIAAFTAFLVVNINFLPALLIWIGPSVVGSILVALSIRNYYRRTSRP